MRGMWHTCSLLSGVTIGVVYKAVHHTVSEYLTELGVTVSTRQVRANLRSAGRGDMSEAANKGATCYCCMSFAVSGPTIWKTFSLLTCEQSLSLEQFRSRLKTELFNQADYVA